MSQSSRSGSVDDRIRALEVELLALKRGEQPAATSLYPADEQFLINISQQTLQGGGSKILDVVLAELCCFLEVDFADLLIFQDNHKTVALGTFPPLDRIEGLDSQRSSFSALPWLGDVLQAGIDIVVNNLDDLPDVANRDRRILEKMEIGGMIATPISHRSTVQGFLCVGLRNQGRIWATREVEICRRFCSQVLAVELNNLLEGRSDRGDQLLTSLLDVASDGYYIWDSNLRQARYSDDCLSSLGYKQGELVNSSGVMMRHMFSEDRVKVIKLFDHCVKTGEPYETEFRMYNKQGDICWRQLRVKSFKRGLQDQTQIIVGTLRDITSLKNAQQSQQRLAEIYVWLSKTISGLFENDDDERINDILKDLCGLLDIDRCSRMIVDDNGYLVYTHQWSDGGFNLEPQPWIGVKVNDIIMLGESLKNDQPLIINDFSNITGDNDDIRDLYLKQNVYAMAVVPIYQNKKLHSLLGLVQCDHPRLWDSEDLQMAGAIGDAIAVALDRKQNAVEMAARDARYSYALDASKDGLWDLDISSGRAFISASQFRMLGYEFQEQPSTSHTLMNVFTHPDDRDDVYKTFYAAINQRAEKWDLQYRLQHKNGQPVWVMCRSKFVAWDEDGLPTRCVGVNVNVSEYKRTADELMGAKLQAEEANSAKSEFLARMSHEIRTPMNAIIGLSHLLESTLLNVEQTDFLKNISTAADSLLEVVNDILDFSKIESGKFSLELTNVNLEEFFGHIFQLMKVKADEKGLELNYSIDSDVPLFFRGDSLRLGQILINLIGNAIKFSESGAVDISIKKKSTSDTQLDLVFSVLDSGIGMTEEQLECLFQPFSQADGSTSRKYGGTGLGLAISRHLVEMMDGEIDCKSQPDKGSEFIFNARFEPLSIDVELWRQRSAQFQNLRILMVGGNEGELLLLKHSAASLELAVDYVDDVNEAMGRLSRSSEANNVYNVLFVDDSLADIDTVNICEKVRRDRVIQVQPIILLLSSQCDIDRNPYIDACVAKPLSASTLFDGLSESLNHKKSSLLDKTLNDDALLAKAHILLVEDNVVNQMVAVGILKKKSVSITIANNGQEAIEILASGEPDRFDLILMDMEMPVVDGYQATKIIREQGRYNNTPIVAMTAHAMRGVKERCFKTGMDGYITKPIDPHLLHKTIAGFLS